MAFNSNPPQQKYTATAGQTTFPYLFKIFDENNITVYSVGVAEDPDLAVPLILNVDYTVTIDGDNGGSVELSVGAEQDDTITIYRRLDIIRYVDYQTSGDLLASTLNHDQDYQTYLVADLANAVEEELSGEGPGAPVSDAVKKSGDTMTGTLVAPAVVINGNSVDAENYGIERVTNTGGTAIKYPDGTMICYDIVDTGETNGETKTFPFPFITVPTVTGAVITNLPRYITFDTIHSSSFKSYKWTDSGGESTVKYNWTAVGRWK